MAFLSRSQRSGWAVLVVSALIASVLAVGSGTANAVIDKEDHKPSFQACVGPALQDRGFTDVSAGHAHRAAINCLAYYRISLGTGTGTTFSPNVVVKRYEMAVFMARGLQAAGVALPSVTDQGFTDIGSAPLFARDMINQLTQLGVIDKDSQFHPHGYVTRAQMATWIINFLAKASDTVNIAGGTITLNHSTADDYFADVRRSAPAAVDRATAALYELDVVNGRSAAPATPGEVPLDFYYEPFETVNRGQMAAYMTRALAHTTLRPAGLTVQYNGALDQGQVSVSVRTSSFKAVAYAAVDVFHAGAADVAQAFKDDGTCNESIVRSVSSIETTPCAITFTEETTDAFGDLSITFSNIATGGTTIWAWTGQDGNKVTRSTNLYRLDVPETAVVRKANQAILTKNQPSNVKVNQFGSSVVYTLQLQDDTGDVVAGVDGEGSTTWTLRTITHRTKADGTKAACVANGTFNYSLDPTSDTTCGTGYTSNATPTAIAVSNKVLTTDSQGRVSFVLTAKDTNPSASVKTDDVRVEYQLIAGKNANGVTLTSRTGDKKDDGENMNQYARFSDRPASAADATVTVEPRHEYLKVGTTGSNATTVRNEVLVRVVDQYGRPLVTTGNARGYKVALHSAGDNLTISSSSPVFATQDLTDLSSPGALPATNNAVDLPRNGVVRYVYSGTPGTQGTTQTLKAALYYPEGATNYKSVAAGSFPTSTLYWALPAASNDNAGTDTQDELIVLADTAANLLVIDAGSSDFRWVQYDANDWFTLAPSGKVGDAPNQKDGLRVISTAVASTLEKVEKVLEGMQAIDSLRINTGTTGTVADNNPKLAYFTYKNDDVRAVARLVFFGTAPAS